MGYTTDFSGSLKPSRPFTAEETKIINDFADERHGGNTQPFAGFPGFWCQWVVNEKGNIEWDGGEKFYAYTAWLQYLVDKFFKPWGVKLKGEITWQGEDFGDVGQIVIDGYLAKEKKGKISYE